MIVEHANRCRSLVYSVIRQAILDHRESLRKSRWEVAEIRREKKLPAATPSEILAHAMNKEPARWIRSNGTAEMSFLWCCDQLGIDPEWVRVRMNRREFLDKASRKIKGQVDVRLEREVQTGA